jgi:hypothetical protein
LDLRNNNVIAGNKRIPFEHFLLAFIAVLNSGKIVLLHDEGAESCWLVVVVV